jgi:hypothetical protein
MSLVIACLIESGSAVLVITKVPKSFLIESIGADKEGKWTLLEFKTDVGECLKFIRLISFFFHKLVS